MRQSNVVLLLLFHTWHGLVAFVCTHLASFILLFWLKTHDSMKREGATCKWKTKTRCIICIWTIGPMIRYEICGNNNTETHTKLKLGPRSRSPSTMHFVYVHSWDNRIITQQNIIVSYTCCFYICGAVTYSKSVLMAFASLSLEVKV